MPAAGQKVLVLLEEAHALMRTERPRRRLLLERQLHKQGRQEPEQSEETSVVASFLKSLGKHRRADARHHGPTGQPLRGARDDVDSAGEFTDGLFQVLLLSERQTKNRQKR